MTNESIGKKELSTESKQKVFEDKLDTLIANLLVPTPKVTNNIDEILSLSYEQLAKISPDECSIFSYQLKQYCYYLQQKENRFRNVEKWAKECLKIVFGQEANNYGNQYTKFEEKTCMIIYGNTYANKLHRISIEYCASANELYSLGSRMLDMAKSLDAMQFNKNKERNND